MKKKERLLVVGGGMAGAAFVEEITGLAPDGYETTLYGAEPHPDYNRVLLAGVLTGRNSLEEITSRGREWYEDRGVELVTGVEVASINRAAKEITLKDGRSERYDRLVLATGALPIIPSIPGVDLPGVVTFRHMGDCERIRERIEGKDGVRAAVIGGGVLGLEAAWALGELGAEVKVVHLAERLMERNLDGRAAALLEADIIRMGIDVLKGRETVGIGGSAEGGVDSLRFSDGTEIDVDLVVLSIGIRPNAGLARESGIHCLRGVVVNDVMQTFDPAVWAVGECVEHRGETFGLVAPVFEQARVLADALAGRGRKIFRSSPAPVRLKVPGVELFSAGRAVCAEGDEAVEYSDLSAGVYRKVVLNGGRVKGVVMYGETTGSAELFADLVGGADVSGRRASLLAGPAPAAQAHEGAMPDTAIVCGCSGVTKGALVEAVASKGLFTREDVRRETGASGSCGGCAPVVDRILEETLGPAYKGGAQSDAVCQCTMYTREDILKNIREQGLATVAEVMETMGWETVGCDTCRPAINYYLSMARPCAAVDDPGSRVLNERTHANVQEDGTFSVVPRMYGGVVTPGELKRIAEAAERFGAGLVKVTGGQRIGIYGIGKKDLQGVWDFLGMPSGFAYAKAVRTVKTCVGSRWCRYGTQDSLALGVRLERKLEGLWTPAKVKIGVNGCPRSCAETAVKDVGVTGVAGGWEVRAGGCGGVETRAGELLAVVKTANEAVEVACAFIQMYREEARYGERTFKWVRRTGMKMIRKAVVEDGEYREALLGRLGEALSTASDPWKGAPGTAPGRVCV